MDNHKSYIIFLIFVACAAVFVWQTSLGLPPRVASHFGAIGTANGYMPRFFYVRFMLALIIGLPTFMTLVTWRALGNSKTRINLPNRDYWLAPERRAKTVAFLRSVVLGFSMLLMSFLCWAHWLVVLANRTEPAQLPETWFLCGIVGFVLALFIGLAAFLSHFRTRI